MKKLTTWTLNFKKYWSENLEKHTFKIYVRSNFLKTPIILHVNILKINSGFWSYHCSSTGLLSIVKRTTSVTKKGRFKTWCFTLWLLKEEWKTINRFILEYLVSFNHTGLPEISFQVQYNLQHTHSIKNVLVITF